MFIFFGKTKFSAALFTRFYPRFRPALVIVAESNIPIPAFQTNHKLINTKKLMKNGLVLFGDAQTKQTNRQIKNQKNREFGTPYRKGVFVNIKNIQTHFSYSFKITA